MKEVVKPTSFMLNGMEKVGWVQWWGRNHSTNVLFNLTSRCNDSNVRNTQKMVRQNVQLTAQQIKTGGNQNYTNKMVYSPVSTSVNFLLFHSATASRATLDLI